MKFAVLKALPTQGLLDSGWTLSIQTAYLKTPEKVVADYDKLVRAIADLELMEKYLREEVLHTDGSTSGLRSVMDQVASLGTLISPILSLFDRRSGANVATVLGDVKNIVSVLPGISKTVPLAATSSLSGTAVRDLFQL